MTALRFKSSDQQPHPYRGPILPMSDEDRTFWKILRERKPHLWGGRDG